ncbi:hypothetical protein ABZ556_00005, partial [Micrococcus luteus]|uniref:hypothetical protein n=1 Tax=Micrococcus luteus TaxID=1270 RepID=UPI0033E487CA
MRLHAEEPDGAADEQPALVVLRGVRVLLRLVEVLDGDQAGQAVAKPMARSNMSRTTDLGV